MDYYVRNYGVRLQRFVGQIDNSLIAYQLPSRLLDHRAASPSRTIPPSASVDDQLIVLLASDRVGRAQPELSFAKDAQNDDYPDPDHVGLTNEPLAALAVSQEPPQLPLLLFHTQQLVGANGIFAGSFEAQAGQLIGQLLRFSDLPLKVIAKLAK